MKKIFIVILFIICATKLIGQVNVIAPYLDAGPIVATVNVPITVSNLTGLNVTSYEFVITFNKDVVNATGISISGTITPGSYFAFGNPDNVNGKISVAAAGITPISGEGILIYLQFNVIQHTQTPLIWQSFTFNSGSPIANLTNGTLVLPVELVAFTVSKIINNNSVVLRWETATEVNNFGFEIERKSETIEWTKIGFVQGNGNSNSPKSYRFIDDNIVASNKFSYRLKQIDNDGKFEYSKIVEIDLGFYSFNLFQNYPNPFNPSTKISYQLPNESKVAIKIYNLLGSEVMELLNEQKEAGIYEVEFNADNLSSGTYIYKISADNFVQTKKMILLK
jgi:hypothetical protein